jgi:integrase
MGRKLITPTVINQRAPKAGRVEVRDTLSPLILRITKCGTRSFIVRARVKGETQPIRLTYETPAHSEVLPQARAWAVETVGQCRQGKDPRQQKALAALAIKASAEKETRNRFGTVADNFLQKHSAKNRSHREAKRIVDLYLRPGWEDRPIDEIGREDVTERLDDIEAATFVGRDGKSYGGPVMVDRVLAQLRKLMNWHAVRDPRFVSPIVKGMGRTKPKDRARTRVLSDEEIRRLWPCLTGTYGAALKILFYTAQRLGEVAQMQRAQIGTDDVWAIPVEAYKGKRPQFVPLTREARAIIDAQPVVDGSDLVFPAQKNPMKQITTWSACKVDLDAKIAADFDSKPMAHWTVHDILNRPGPRIRASILEGVSFCRKLKAAETKP